MKEQLVLFEVTYDLYYNFQGFVTHVHIDGELDKRLTSWFKGFLWQICLEHLKKEIYSEQSN